MGRRSGRRRETEGRKGKTEREKVRLEWSKGGNKERWKD